MNHVVYISCSLFIGRRYAKRGNVSPKVDVYAFGVVLYELISAKEAVVKTHGSTAKGLVSLVSLIQSSLCFQLMMHMLIYFLDFYFM